MPDSDFLHRTIPHLGKRAHRLGLAFNYGLDARGLSYALDVGVNYFFWTPFRTGSVTPTLIEALRVNRAKYIIATGPTLGFFAGGVRGGCERLLRKLKVEYIDIFHLFWLGTASAWTEGTIAELTRLRDEGKIRSIGISIHDRERAGKLVGEAPLDLVMLRYNAAHPGAERDVFPHLGVRKPAVVAYTATAWKKLLKKPRGWTEAMPTAGDCYRFCLTSPHVDVTLCGPKDLAELEANLASLAKGPLSADEEAWMRRFGQAVHG